MVRILIIAFAGAALLCNVQPTLGKRADRGETEKEAKTGDKEETLLRLLLSTFLASGDLKNASVVAEKGTRLFPEDPYWWERVAEISSWRGRSDDALRAYITAYRLSGKDTLRKKAFSLAVALNRFDLAKELMEEDIESGKVDDIKNILFVYEQSGDIDALIAVLEGIIEKDRDRKVAGHLARIYFSYGRPEDAARILRETEETFGLKPDDALFYTEVLYSLRRYADALDLLKRHMDKASPGDARYWETMSDLAWGLQEYDTSVQASRILRRTGRARAVDYERLFLYWNGKDPGRAMNYALEGWRSFKTSYLLYHFLTAAASLGRWDQIVTEIKRLDREDIERFLKDPYFTAVYAQALRNARGPEHAKRLYARVLKENFSKELLSQYIYLLLDYEDDRGLKGVARDYGRLANEPGLLMPFTLLYAKIGNGRKALTLAERLPDDTATTRLLRADILSLYGRHAEAEALRFNIYRDMRDKLKKNPELLEDGRFLEEFLRVAPYYESPRIVAGYMALAKEVLPQKTANDIELSYLMGIEGRTMVEHLIRKYNYAARPWMYLNLALWEDARYDMAELLGKHPYTLPARDRVEALRRTGRIKDAMQHAYLGLYKNREDHLLYKQFSDLARNYQQTAGVTLYYEERGPYEETAEEISFELDISKGFEAAFFYTGGRTVDSDKASLVNAPDSRNIYGIRLSRLFDRGRLKLAAGSHKGIKENVFYTVGLDSYHLLNGIRLGLFYGKNVRADENVYLHLAGMKDRYAVSASYSFERRSTLNVRLSYQRFRSQDGPSVGSSMNVYSEASYRVRTGYPDYTVRVYLDSVRFNEGTRDKGAIRTLFPYEPESVLPESYNMAGAGVLFGLDDRYGHAGPWRPFLSLDVTLNDKTGPGFSTSVGIGGGVLRRDSLSAGIEYVKGFKGTEDEYLRLFASYRLLY